MEIITIFNPFVNLYLFGDKYVLYLLLEATVLGLITMSVGYGFSVTFFRRELTNDCKECADKNYVKMLGCLFVTGLTVHLFLEMTRVHRWYVMNGAAAMA